MRTIRTLYVKRNIPNTTFTEDPRPVRCHPPPPVDKDVNTYVLFPFGGPVQAGHTGESNCFWQFSFVRDLGNRYFPGFYGTGTNNHGTGNTDTSTGTIGWERGSRFFRGLFGWGYGNVICTRSLCLCNTTSCDCNAKPLLMQCNLVLCNAASFDEMWSLAMVERVDATLPLRIHCNLLVLQCDPPLM